MGIFPILAGSGTGYGFEGKHLVTLTASGGKTNRDMQMIFGVWVLKGLLSILESIKKIHIFFKGAMLYYDFDCKTHPGNAHFDPEPV